MIQPTLFSAIAIKSNQADFSAEELTQEAISRAEAHADPTWKKNALAALRTLCETHWRFSMDQMDEVMRETKEPRALGAMIRQAAKNGWCFPTQMYKPSTLSRRHKRPVKIWQSLLCPAR